MVIWRTITSCSKENCEVTGYRVSVQCTGYRSQGKGYCTSTGYRALGVPVQGTGYRVQGTGYRVQGTGYWYRVQGTGYRVQGTGYRVLVQGTGYSQY